MRGGLGGPGMGPRGRQDGEGSGRGYRREGEGRAGMRGAKDGQGEPEEQGLGVLGEMRGLGGDREGS